MLFYYNHCNAITLYYRLEEGGRRKCGQYWPLEKDFQACYGTLAVTNLGMENLTHYRKTILEIYNCEVSIFSLVLYLFKLRAEVNRQREMQG